MTRQLATVPPDLRENFAAYLREGHFLSDIDGALSISLYRALGLGELVSRASLAATMSIEPPAFDRLMKALPASNIDLDDNGRIVAFGGLSIITANHEFIVEGNTLYTWCVFDALFLPEILGKSARARSRCPTTGERIDISLTPDRIAAASPVDPVMSITAPDQAACCEDLRGAFCNQVNFFVNLDAFQEWAGERPGIGHVSLTVAHDLARQRNAYRYGELLRNQ